MAASVSSAVNSLVIRAAITLVTSANRRYTVIRLTPARRAMSVSVVRRTPTDNTQVRAASSSAASATRVAGGRFSSADSV